MEPNRIDVCESLSTSAPPLGAETKVKIKGPVIIRPLISNTRSPVLLRQIDLKNSKEQQTNSAPHINGNVVHCLIDNIDRPAQAPHQAQLLKEPVFSAETKKYIQNINGAVDSATYGCLMYTSNM